MQPHATLVVRSNDCGWSDLRIILASMPNVDVVGEARDGARASELADTLRPSVFIAPTVLNGASTMPLLARLRNDILLDSKFVVISPHFHPEDVIELAKIRVSAELLWSDLTTQSLRQVLETILLCDIVMSSRTLTEGSAEIRRDEGADERRHTQLSVRERQILNHLSKGHSYDEIAEVERLSRRSVARTVAALEAKLNARTQFTLGKKVTQLGLLD